jgi:hypothetical protein
VTGYWDGLKQVRLENWAFPKTNYGSGLGQGLLRTLNLKIGQKNYPIATKPIIPLGEAIGNNPY